MYFLYFYISSLLFILNKKYYIVMQYVIMYKYTLSLNIDYNEKNFYNLLSIFQFISDLGINRSGRK